MNFGDIVYSTLWYSLVNRVNILYILFNLASANKLLAMCSIATYCSFPLQRQKSKKIKLKLKNIFLVF